MFDILSCQIGSSITDQLTISEATLVRTSLLNKLPAWYFSSTEKIEITVFFSTLRTLNRPSWPGHGDCALTINIINPKLKTIFYISRVVDIEVLIPSLKNLPIQLLALNSSIINWPNKFQSRAVITNLARQTVRPCFMRCDIWLYLSFPHLLRSMVRIWLGWNRNSWEE